MIAFNIVTIYFICEWHQCLRKKANKLINKKYDLIDCQFTDRKQQKKKFGLSLLLFVIVFKVKYFSIKFSIIKHGAFKLVKRFVMMFRI